MTEGDPWLSKSPWAFQHNLTNLHSTVCNSLLPPPRDLMDGPTNPVKEGSYMVGVIISILHMVKQALSG